MKHPARALAALLFAASIACDGDVLTPPGGMFVAQLAPAYARWHEKGPASYDFTLRYNCFCGPDFTRPVIVSVRNGVVTDRRYADDHSPVNPQLSSSFTTIDSLFTTLTDAYSRNAASVTVTYDNSYGYPTAAFIDYIAQAADDELGFSVSNFTPR